MHAWEQYLQDNEERFEAELLDFLRIPSISALPEHKGDVQRAAEWVAERLRAAGAEGVRVMPTEGHPVVYGEWLHAPGKPTVLIYGHFDVQPVDPLDLWTRPPFEPEVVGDRLYARGASDTKGNVLLTMAAVEALLRTTDALPLNVKFLYEGQEEIGSPNLPPFIAANRKLLACDVVLNSDSLQWSESEPALLVGLRGICAAEIKVEGASSDLHSGLYGGAVANPLHALAALVASFHSEDGKVAVEGFYDDVLDLTAEERAQLAEIPFDESEYLAELGLDELFGEEGYTTYERLWTRPTLDIVGMWGGFQGVGVKTVLAREAQAKITCRLVPNQTPAAVLDRIEAHVKRHAPPGVKVTFTRRPSAGNPYLMPLDHPANAAAASVLRELYGRDPYPIRMGGSVPITGLFLDHLGAYSVSFGFALPDEKFHAPDEFVRLASFHRGQRAYAMLLERLGSQ